jgi:hypothetical protein
MGVVLFKATSTPPIPGHMYVCSDENHELRERERERKRERGKIKVHRILQVAHYFVFGNQNK